VQLLQLANSRYYMKITDLNNLRELLKATAPMIKLTISCQSNTGKDFNLEISHDDEYIYISYLSAEWILPFSRVDILYSALRNGFKITSRGFGLFRFFRYYLFEDNVYKRIYAGGSFIAPLSGSFSVVGKIKNQ